MTPTLDALKRYLDLREQLADLEEPGGCTCDLYNFHRCELCEQEAELSRESRQLVDLWGDNWAVLLGQHVANELNEVSA